jgi:YHS domain-containing protein
MGFLSRLFRFVFWVVIVSWVIKLVGRLLSGGVGRQGSTSAAGSAEQVNSAAAGKRLVRDPVCGMHVAEEVALPMSANGETQYFCSPECRAKYENSVLRRSASA